MSQPNKRFRARIAGKELDGSFRVIVTGAPRALKLLFILPQYSHGACDLGAWGEVCQDSGIWHFYSEKNT